MCGIVGYVGNKQVVPLIIDGLRKLEYRGYDSAGIAVVNEKHELEIRRAEGKLRNLEEAIRLSPIDGTYGIGHTRWATHGRPTEENAHPHRDCTGRVVVVHNGIIENYLQLKERLRKSDHLNPLADIPDSERSDLALALVRNGLVLASCDAPRAYADAEDEERSRSQSLWGRVKVTDYKRRCSK